MNIEKVNIDWEEVELEWEEDEEMDIEEGDIDDSDIDWEDDENIPNNPSYGLGYKLTKDKKGYRVVSIGICKDENVVVPETFNDLPVIAIKDHAFANCKQIKSLVIPNSVKRIGKNIITGCYRLKKLVVPFMGEYRDDAELDHCCFRYFFDAEFFLNNGCVLENVKKVIINGGEKISGDAFTECAFLKKIQLPPTLREIEKGHAFFWLLRA